VSEKKDSIKGRLVNLEASFLRKLRRANVRSHDLLALRVVGGPVSTNEKVQVPFLPDQNTTPRSIELRCSDAGVFVVLWRVGKDTYSVALKLESDAQGFYNVKMKALREAALAEAAQIKARLSREFDESWRNAKTVYFHKGFRMQVYFSYSEERAKINRQLQGLIHGSCPFCGTTQVFDVKEPFQKFLQTIDAALTEPFMPSHGGQIAELGISTRSRCETCLTYPNVSFTAQANKGLLARLKKLGIAGSEPEG